MVILISSWNADFRWAKDRLALTESQRNLPAAPVRLGLCGVYYYAERRESCENHQK